MIRTDWKQTVRTDGLHFGAVMPFLPAAWQGPLRLPPGRPASTAVDDQSGRTDPSNPGCMAALVALTATLRWPAYLSRLLNPPPSAMRHSAGRLRLSNSPSRRFRDGVYDPLTLKWSLGFGCQRLPSTTFALFSFGTELPASRHPSCEERLARPDSSLRVIADLRCVTCS
jgi:hypothetical protein